MYDAFEAFVNKPTAVRYRKVRSLILSDFQFQPSLASLTGLIRLQRAARYGQLRRQIAKMMPHWALCPRVHVLAADAAQQLNDPEDAELEWLMASACLQGILATGHGTAQRPFLVTYCGDAYEVLEALRLRAQGQVLTQSRGRQLDVITCHDGSEVWFDVTSLFRHGPVLSEPVLA